LLLHDQMKKKESFWKLLRRLDEQAGEFNAHINEANRYFDAAADGTKKIIARHEKDIQTAISSLKKLLKKISRKKAPGRKPK